jgi:putative ABC transport system substrate-binding protein
MRRRDVLGLLGAAAAFLTRVPAQAAGAKRLGVRSMNPAPEVDAVYKPRVAALRKGLQALGWREGENLNVDWRFVGADWARLEAYADQLVALALDALLAISTPAAEALLKRTRTMPIVFTLVTDPIDEALADTGVRS